MADSTLVIPALNGLEIINDLCGLISEKLSGDCNLREIDGYAGGYKATVKIHLEAFGLDTASVDYEISTDETVPDPSIPIQEQDVNLDAELEIPVEPDLSIVRDRSNQIAGDFEMKPVITEDGPVTPPQRRKYSRRLKALGLDSGGQAQGGAAGEMDE